MPNVVGAIRNLCQNSTANKDAVREAGGIAGLVELLKAGESSSAAMKAAETLEVSDPPLMTLDCLPHQRPSSQRSAKHRASLIASDCLPDRL